MQVTPVLFKSSHYALHFYERPNISTFSLTERYPKRIFTFRKKGRKQDSIICFGETLYRGSAHSPSSFPRNYTGDLNIQLPLL